MIETLFVRGAAKAGWTDAGRIAVLLRYAATPLRRALVLLRAG